MMVQGEKHAPSRERWNVFATGEEATNSLVVRDFLFISHSDIHSDFSFKGDLSSVETPYLCAFSRSAFFRFQTLLTVS